MGHQIRYEGHVFGGGQTWDQIIKLEHKAHMVAAVTGELRFISGGETFAPKKNFARTRNI